MKDILFKKFPEPYASVERGIRHVTFALAASFIAITDSFGRDGMHFRVTFLLSY